MSCGKRRARVVGVEQVVQSLFDRGKPEAAMQHRMTVCCHATKCGRLCEYMIKSPGKALVYCVPDLKPVDPSITPTLYEKLGDPDFVCPRRLF